MGLDKLLDHHHRQVNRKAWGDLRQFTDALQKDGQLKSVSQPVSAKLQVTALCHRSLLNDGPALFFENIEGSAIPVLGNLFGNEQRVLAALELKTRQDLFELGKFNEAYAEDLSFGQELADKVSRFVGSWVFILFFTFIMVAWVIYNSYLAVGDIKPFDPYPYILLNLGLSTLAAIQAPVIMMSQNRQSEKDKLKVDANYQVSLKTDLEIRLLNQKVDELLKAAGSKSEIKGS